MRLFISVAALLSVASTCSYGQAYSLDPTFGVAGKALVTFPTAATTDAATKLAVQSDGRILVVGQNNKILGLARLTASGQPDTGFGNAGTTTTTFVLPAGTDPFISIVETQPVSMLMQADGKIVVGSSVYTSGGTYRGYARYLPAGAPDNTFASTGRVVASKTGSLGGPLVTVVQQTDGALVGVGIHRGLSYFGIHEPQRITSTGSRDVAYAHTYPLTGNETSIISGQNVAKEPYAATLDNTGRLVTAGTHTVSNQNYVGPQGAAIVRFLANGNYDPSFATAGIAVLPKQRGGDRFSWRQIMRQADNKLVVAAILPRSSAAVTDSVIVARYQPDGTLDASFGKQGIAQASFGAASGDIFGLQLLSSGSFLVGVRSATSFSLVRISAMGLVSGMSASVITVPGMQAADLVLLPNDNALVAGTATDALGNKQFAVVRLSSSTQLSTRGAISSHQVDLYPNPAAHQLTLRLTGVAANQLLGLQVLDVLGRAVLSLSAVPTTAGEVQLPLHTIRPGSYTLRIQGFDFALTRQFVRAE